MFGKTIRFHGTALIEAEIVSSALPETMPLVSDGIENLGSGYTLAPGSVMTVTGEDKKYMLGTDGTWAEMPRRSSGGEGGGTLISNMIFSSVPVINDVKTGGTENGTHN